MTNSGTKKPGMAKIMEPHTPISKETRNTLYIFNSSLLPQYWDESTPEPLLTPNISREKTKNNLFAKPTAAILVSPSFPIIKVSTRLTILFKRF